MAIATEDTTGEEDYLDAVEALADHYGVEAASESVTTDGPADRIQYLTAGDGPPLLCLHSMGRPGAAWLPAFEALSAEFTVYAPDRPGRGLSTPVDYSELSVRRFFADSAAAFLDAVGAGEAAVVGNSLGGYQALVLAADHPERVTRLCALGAPVGLTRSIPTDYQLLQLPVVGPRLFGSVDDQTPEDVRDVTQQMEVVDDAGLPDAYFEMLLAAEKLPGRRESLWSLLGSFARLRGLDPAFDVRDDLADVEAPTRFVWGAEDEYWPPSLGHEAVESMPDAEMVVLDDHGHSPWLEPGDEAAEAAVEFLADGR